MAVILVKPVETFTVAGVKASILGIDPLSRQLFQGSMEIGSSLTPPPTFAAWSIDGTHPDGTNHLDANSPEFTYLVETARKLGL